jgi:hydroxypyruvate isomerase
LQRIEQAHELGFPAIEFWPWRGKDLDAIAKRTQELGMEVAQFTAWGFSPGLNEAKNHEKFVKEIEASCAAAKQLRCKMMTVVGGNDVKGMTQQAMHEQIIAGLKLAAPIAEREGIMLILEPMNIRVDHKGHCLYGSEAAVRICRAVGYRSRADRAIARSAMEASTGSSEGSASSSGRCPSVAMRIIIAL